MNFDNYYNNNSDDNNDDKKKIENFNNSKKLLSKKSKKRNKYDQEVYSKRNEVHDSPLSSDSTETRIRNYGPEINANKDTVIFLESVNYYSKNPQEMSRLNDNASTSNSEVFGYDTPERHSLDEEIDEHDKDNGYDEETGEETEEEYYL